MLLIFVGNTIVMLLLNTQYFSNRLPEPGLLSDQYAPPDILWKTRYPNNWWNGSVFFFAVREITDTDGSKLVSFTSWLGWQFDKDVVDNCLN